MCGTRTRRSIIPAYDKAQFIFSVSPVADLFISGYSPVHIIRAIIDCSSNRKPHQRINASQYLHRKLRISRNTHNIVNVTS